jgi:hypothetical protein
MRKGRTRVGKGLEERGKPLHSLPTLHARLAVRPTLNSPSPTDERSAESLKPVRTARDREVGSRDVTAFPAEAGSACLSTRACVRSSAAQGVAVVPDQRPAAPTPKQCVKRATRIFGKRGTRRSRSPRTRHPCLSAFCQTDYPGAAGRRSSRSRTSIASVLSNLRSKWTSYRAGTSKSCAVYAAPIAWSRMASRCSNSASGSSYHAVLQFGERIVVPRLPMACDPDFERLGRRGVSQPITRPLGQASLPIGPRVFAQRRQGTRIGIRAACAQDVPRATRHGLVALHIPQFTRGFGR